jgi:hypothetical protein
MAVYDTDDCGVRLKLVRVTRDVYFVDGRLKVAAGACGRLASDDRGWVLINFERSCNAGYFVALDGSGRRSQSVPVDAVEDL